MEPFVLVLTGVSVILAARLARDSARAIGQARARRRREAWRDAVPGLDATGWRRPDGQADLRGIVNGFDCVVISGRRFVRLIVTGHVGQLRWLSAGRADGDPAPPRRATAGRAFRTGDDLFDARVRLRGSAGAILGVMGSIERKAVLDFLCHPDDSSRRWIQAGQLVIDEAPALAGPAWLAAAVDETTRVARLLAHDGLTMAPLLVINAASDPEPVIRAACLAILASRTKPRASLRSREALMAAIGDPHPSVRLVAAAALANRAELQRLAANGEADAEVRDLAARQVSGDPLPLLSLHLQHPWTLVGFAVMRHLARRPLPDLLDTLLERGPSGDGMRDAFLAELLASLPDPRAEPMLIALLESESKDARAAAIRALERCGTIAAVAPLLAMTDRRLRVEALTAARSIQSRLGNVDAGRLTLADTTSDGGRLSSFDDDGGLDEG